MPANQGTGTFARRIKAIAVAVVAAALLTGAQVALAGGAKQAKAGSVSYERWGTTMVAKTAETSITCKDPKITRPFARFGDNRNYVLAPQGAFENRDVAGWQLHREAAVVNGNEQFYLRGITDRRSLSLPEGSSVTSPAMCVDLDYPTARLVTKSARKSLRSGGTGLPPVLRIEVIYPATGALFQQVAMLDSLSGTPELRGWRASNDVSLLPALAELGPGQSKIALRFTAVTGDWSIDDLYVDPRRHS